MGESDSSTGHYSGVERRNEQRRLGGERRTEFRFELDKEERRRNSGRRATDDNVWRSTLYQR